MMRVGFGYDVHRLAAGRSLFLGGLRIPHPAGLVGHSDGDALIHALIDALLGALGEGDIGGLFPDTDPRYKNVRSTDLLEAVAGSLRKRKIRVLHADCVIVAERPKIGPHVRAMKNVLTTILGLRPDQLGIQAKTNEGLGLIGRGKAIACWAVVLVGGRDSGGIGRA
jgi:2-C-methyl-D-erythritol 2,4-cyclodiphosphate synthase